MQFHSLQSIEDVQTGEVKVAEAGALLANAIGSCIALIAYDAKRLVGGIAHIMLPGRAPSRCESETRYAENAFGVLLDLMSKAGCAKEDIVFFCAGGANVLMDVEDSLCRANINSIEELCRCNGIRLAGKSLGGYQRRCVGLDIREGVLLCAIGDDDDFVLWNKREA